MKYWVIAKDDKFLSVDYTFDVDAVWEFASKVDAEDVVFDLKMNGVVGAEVIEIEYEIEMEFDQ